MAETTEALPSAPAKKTPAKPAGTGSPDFSPAPTTTDTDGKKKKAPDTDPAKKTDTSPKPPTKDGDDGEKPKLPTTDTDSDDDKLPQPDEEGVYTATLVNRQQDVEKRIREEAKEQHRKASTELQWWRLIKKAKFKWGEDYYVNRGIDMLRKAAIENNNVFVDMDVITSEASKIRQRFRKMTGRAPIAPVDRFAGRDKLRDQDAHRSEARAKLEQISLGQQVGETDSKFQQVEEASKELKDLMATEIFKPIMSGTINTEEQLQEKLREFVDTHTGETADPAIKAQLDKMFGQAATEFNERAQMFAANFLEIGQAMARDERAHGKAIENIGDKIRINLANTEWAASTQVEMNWADRKATQLKSTKYGRYINETTMGALVSVGTFFGMRLAGKGASAALTAVGAGALMGAVIGAHERSRNLKKDIATHRARTEYGQKVDTTPTQGRTGKVKDRMNMDRKLEEFRYKHIASVDDLLNNDGSRPRESDESDPRGLNEIMKAFDAAPNDPQAREAMIRRVSEIQSRLLFSAEKGAGFIDFGDRRATESGRLALVKGVAEAKKKLVDAMIAQGDNKDNATLRMNRLLSTARDGWQNTWSEDKTQQDKAFTSYRRRSAATHGVIGAATGAVTGLLTQQAIAEIGAHVFDNKPVAPTLLQQAGEKVGLNIPHSHELEHSQSIAQLHEALKAGSTGNVVESLGDLGISVHAEDIPGLPNDRIVIDNVNGVPVDARVPATLTYNPESDALVFAGEIPDAARQVLEDNYFSVGETQMGNEAMQANPMPHLETIPGTNLQVNIPGGTELQGPPGGPFDLVIPATDTEAAITVATGMQFDAAGHLVDHRILRPDLVQLGTPEPGPTNSVDTDRWLEEHRSGRGIDQWYGNNTRESNLNELRAYNYRSESGTGVTFDMSNMKFASWQEGNVPYSFDVQQEINDGNAVMALWNRGNPDQVDVLIRVPEDGKLTFDRNSQEMLDIYRNGQWEQVPASEVSQMFIAEDLRDFQTSSEVNPQYRDLFSRNFSMGVMSDKDGEQVFSSFATGFGRGETPPTIGSGPTEIQNFTAVPQTEVHFPDSWEPVPIDLPVTPRRHLGDAQQGENPETPPVPPRPEGGSSIMYDGWEVFRKPDGSPASMTDVLRFRNGAEVAPPELKSFNYDATLSSEIGNNPEGEAALKAVKEKFEESKDIYMILSGPIGDAVVNSAYIEGLRRYADKVEPGKKITIVAPPHILTLLGPTAAKYDVGLVNEADYPSDDMPKAIVERNNLNNAFILELKNGSVLPTIDQLPNGGLAVKDLLAASIAMYDQNRSGNERFSAFLGDFLSVPPEERINIYPQLELPANHAEIFNRLKNKYNIDTNKPQVALVVEASHKMKRYSLQQWRDVLQEIAAQHPGTEFNILYNTDPQSASYTADQLRSVFDAVPGARLVSGDLTEQTVLLQNQRLVLANDTGLAHIAATVKDGPQVVSVHLPRFSPNIWVTNADRHTGITPDAAALRGLSFDEQAEDGSDQKWINKISPATIAQQALQQFESQQSVSNPEQPTPQQTLNETETQEARSHGLRWQNFVATESSTIPLPDRSLLVARQLLDRDLTPEERDIVLNNPQWGEEISLRARRERGDVVLTVLPESAQVPPPAPPAPEPGGGTAVESAVDLPDAGSATENINRAIAEGSENQHTFELNPDVFADFIKANPTLLGNGIGVTDLHAEFVNGNLQLRGELTFGGKELTLTGATIEFTPEGEMKLVGKARYVFKNTGRVESAVRSKAADIKAKNLDDRFRLGVNGLIEDESWGVENFRAMNGKIIIDVSNKPEVRRRFSAAYEPGPGPVTAPERGDFGGATTSDGLTDEELDAMFDAMPPVSEIPSADRFTETMNTQLQSETDDAHIFMVDGKTLAQYLSEETNHALAERRLNQIFGGRAFFDSLDIRLRGSQIVISGRMHHTVDGRVNFSNAVFNINPDGQMEIVGEPTATLADGMKNAMAPDSQSVADIKNFGGLTMQVLNQRIDRDWQAQGFALFDGQIGIRTERQPDESTTTIPSVDPAATGPMPAVEPGATGPMPAADPEGTGPMPVSTDDGESTGPLAPPVRRPAPGPTIPEETRPQEVHVNKKDILIDPDGNEWEVRRVREINVNGAIRPSRRETVPDGIVLRRVGGKVWDRMVLDPDELDAGSGWRVRNGAENPEPLPGEVRIASPIEITSSGSMIPEMIQELNEDTDVQHQFNLDPQILSQFLVDTTKDSTTDLLGDVLNVEDMTMKVDAGRLILSGKMKIGGGEELHLENMEFTLGPEGRLVPAGPPAIRELAGKDFTDPTAKPYEIPVIKLRTFGSNLSNLLRKKLGDQWQVSGFGLNGDKFSIIAGMKPTTV